MNTHDTRSPATLAQLEQRDDFIGRHVGPDIAETRAMLDALGLESLDQLIDKVIPASILSASPLALPEGRSEPEALAMLLVLFVMLMIILVTCSSDDCDDTRRAFGETSAEYQQCKRNAGSGGSRTSGGSWGGYSSGGGGHK